MHTSRLDGVAFRSRAVSSSMDLFSSASNQKRRSQQDLSSKLSDMPLEENDNVFNLSLAEVRVAERASP